jgi:hypothetical protein
MPFIGRIIQSDQVDACTESIIGKTAHRKWMDKIRRFFWKLNHRQQAIKANPKLLKSNFDSIRVRT